MEWKINEESVFLDCKKTPYFLIEEEELSTNLSQLKSALEKHWDNYIIGYSFKTNSLPWLLKYFKKNGLYAEVVSDDEYQLALLLGYEKSRLIYNGPPKSKETFYEAIHNRCIVNIESQRELNWLKELDQLGYIDSDEYEVGIRVNFDLERYCPNESSMGDEGGRFGFCYENGELKKAIDCLNSLKKVKLTGLHLHCSSKTRSLNVYRTISKIACEIKRKYSLQLKYIDVGGGFYGGLKNKLQFKDYMKIISEELNKEFCMNETILIVEPGTPLVSSAISFVTKVIDVKKTLENYFVTTDGSRIYLDPFKRKSNYLFHIKYRNTLNVKEVSKQVISGFTCMEDDRLFVLRDSPQLKVGDLVIYQKVGAYTMCLSPLFIKYFPTVYVKKKNEILEVRERWTASNFIELNTK
ncbi:pyridoxal-dependent decarboxylase [Lysinibacillus antri]|uniref:Pyridoxal-dependent decarboxylase n=1 Tax=Lysinibacillus antri TaxID=2498145 RepID=A0A3S0WHN8_9BACI|nr:pyridoxal-dependent decarboxylase [Lysinibacillus antri]RUL55180.1 pyridoxal-dependent decarboxylase [Lysinibacillus antri]